MKNLIKISMLVVLSISLGTSYAQVQYGEGIINKYPKEQAEVKAVLDDIFQSIKNGEVDRLISFHAYTPKFTEFKGGAPRNGGAENESHERNVFGSVTEVVKLNSKDLKIAVYHGNVANVTFHSDFHLKFGEDAAEVYDQISVLFVKADNGDWKIVHEHHSPLSQ